MPQIPRFFYNGPLTENSSVSLDADTAKHIWQVLRMQPDDKVILTDGKGTVAEGTIHTAERHKCDVSIEKVAVTARKGNVLHLCVAFTKNNSRNEWLLEKATELGVGSIIPITTTRSEKAHVRHDRWQKILQSAILQSQQSYLPELAEISPLKSILKKYNDIPQKLIAHCIPEGEKHSLAKTLKPTGEVILLIGPEGDFTQEEVNLCMENGFVPVSLGAQRLRTETAAIAAAAYFNVVHDEEI
ncbi:MAG: Ribosomal small subunit methyltransferase [Flavipsychrobacter sp.]|nr:Ribosomal small subunit methyltransferase [Flavipsychrobacter sp.]